MNKLVVVGSIAVLCCANAIAGEGTQTAKAVASFQTLDKNADQQISRTEAGMDRKLSNNFAIWDANGDGFLSKEEYDARTKS